MNVFDFLLNYPLAYQCFIAILGLLVGSFLNVVIVRLPRSFISEQDDRDLVSTLPSSILRPASECPECRNPIRPWDNIPILSYCYLKGRCRYCKCAISSRYLAIELLTAALSLFVSLRFGMSLNTVAGLLLTWALIPLAFIDCEHMILPDCITLPFLWLGLFISLFGVFQNSSDAILGAIIGYLSLASVYWIFKLITHKEGMGFGDFKLLAMLGAWLGWQALPFIILLASILGAGSGIILIFSRKIGKNIPIPFGPYLAISGWLAMLFGQNIATLYLWIL